MSATHVHDLTLEQRRDPPRGASWPTRAVLHPGVAVAVAASTPHVERLARHPPQCARLGHSEITAVDRVEHLSSLLHLADSFETHPQASSNVLEVSGMSPRRGVNEVPGTYMRNSGSPDVSVGGWVGDSRSHPVCFLGFRAVEGSEIGRQTGCGTQGYGARRSR